MRDGHFEQGAVNVKDAMSKITYEDPGHFFEENNEVGTADDDRVRSSPRARTHTHTHTHARARTRTHTHTRQDMVSACTGKRVFNNGHLLGSSECG